MVAFALDDDDRGSNASSEVEQDELMEDADDPGHDIDEDAEGEGDGEGEGEGEGEGDQEDDENAEEDGEEEQEDGDDDSPERPRRSSPPDAANRTPTPGVNGSESISEPHPTLTKTSASPREVSVPLNLSRFRYEVRPEALTASSYDIVPTMAAPQSTSINAITATPDMRYWFSGGSDCYIRKYDGIATINGKTLLTVAQRHPFVDSVVKAGVLMSYCDNEEPISKSLTGEATLSPVYSLAVQSEALWILSGLESGAVNLLSVRHEEGKRIASLQKHTSAVSVLALAKDERSVLSGSWDKNIYDWDLNTGQARRSFEGSGGQISAIEIRPASTLPVPEAAGEAPVSDGTFSSNNEDKPVPNGLLSNGDANGDTNGLNGDVHANEDAPGSPEGSLFGGGETGNSLFGDDDDEFSRALQIDHRPDSSGDTVMGEALPEAQAPPPAQPAEEAISETVRAESQANGLPHAEVLPTFVSEPETQDAAATSDSTFLASSIDGTIRIWDRRQPNPVARILPKTGVPPWCMSACWSPDGNFFYAGRRNGTVEEYSLHKGLKAPERTFKFPLGSNAVTAIRAMPNGRHIVCASYDILRLYDLKQPQTKQHSTVPFLIVPGPPRAGVISALHVDPTCRYMISAAGNRGWEGSTTEVMIGYEIGIQA